MSLVLYKPFEMISNLKSNKSSKTMGSQQNSCDHTITTPCVTSTLMKKQTFEIKREVTSYSEFDWYTQGIVVPLDMNKLETFPSALRSFQRRKLPQQNIECSITILKKKFMPELVMQLDNLEDLSELIPEATVWVIAEGSFRGYTFKTNTDILVENGRGESNIHINEHFLKNFERDVGFRSHTGFFTVKAYWKFSLAPVISFASNKYFEDVLSDDTQIMEGTIKLKSRDGDVFKWSKGMLTAFSPRFKAQIRFGVPYAVTDEMSVYTRQNHALSTPSLKAFLKFMGGSIEDPLNDCGIAVDLLMAGEYNLIPDMENAMQKILVAKPREWFDLGDAATLLWYTTGKIQFLRMDRAPESVESQKWERLKVKALWILARSPTEKLAKCETLKHLFPNQFSLTVFRNMVELMQCLCR